MKRQSKKRDVMSIKDYVNLVAPEPSWLRRIGEASRRRGTHTLTMSQINAEIRASRREARTKARVK